MNFVLEKWILFWLFMNGLWYVKNIGRLQSLNARAVMFCERCNGLLELRTSYFVRSVERNWIGKTNYFEQGYEKVK